MSSEILPGSSNSILVTGATSYLGSRLVECLLKTGCWVHVVVRPTSDETRLGPPADNLIIHEHDGSQEDMTSLVENSAPDVIFHLATRYLRQHVPAQIESLINANILFGTQVLEAMKQTGAKRLIHPATFFQFYDSDTYRPVNLYAATKQAFEDVLAYYVDAHDFLATTLVFHDIYGPFDWRKKLMTTIRKAQQDNKTLSLASPDMLMDLMYVDDAVSALVHAMKENIVGGPYAVSSGNRHTLSEIIATFDMLGSCKIECHWDAFPLPPRNPTEPWVGPVLPGWQPQTSLEEGIRNFLAPENSHADRRNTD
jgi:nucleoside-diphosphate-sugar epimerase